MANGVIILRCVSQIYHEIYNYFCAGKFNN
ncbi:unnamed protein product [Leptidea sinapis]|uniref:Uncharacterized protein n=1 Tax=Leptidea sinapis TaxID=189913 RepID=A0A5E4QEX3_9NEOP|nr:unnamed protein product [Leptidea sinapis]